MSTPVPQPNLDKFTHLGEMGYNQPTLQERLDKYYQDMTKLNTVGEIIGRALDAEMARSVLGITSSGGELIGVPSELATTGTPSASTALFGDGAWKEITISDTTIEPSDIQDVTVIGEMLMTAATEASGRSAISAASVTDASNALNVATTAQSTANAAQTTANGKASQTEVDALSDVVDDHTDQLTSLASGGVAPQIIDWTGSAYTPTYDSSNLSHRYVGGPNPLSLGLPFGVYDQWWRLNSPVPGPANTITIDGQKKLLSGTDITRGSGQIIRYLRSVNQGATPTGPNGIEVTVSLVTGLVVSINDRVVSGSTTGTSIPVDHYVLSGEGKGSGTAGQWLLDRAQVGDLVTLTQEITPPTDPDPEEPPVTPSGLNAKPMILEHAGYQAASPAISAYPAPVLAEVNTIRLNYAAAATSGTGSIKYTEANGQTVAQTLAAVTAHKTAGRAVFLAIGGGGGNDGGITVTNDAEADQMVASVKGLVTGIGINGIVFDIQSTRWNQAAIVRVASRLKTDLGNGFVIGINNKSTEWIAVGVALANNLDYMSPGLWNQVEATDSRLTALTVNTVNAMVTAGIPAAKVVPIYNLGAAVSNLTPTTALVDTAWLAAKAAQPNIRGIGFFDDYGQAARTTPYDGPLNVGPTIRGVQSGRITSFTATRDGTNPTTELDLAWVYTGTATISSWALTRSGGGSPATIAQPTSATRAYTDSGLTAGVTYTYGLSANLSTGEIITASVTQSTQSTTVPGTGTWLSGASAHASVSSGAFGTWRGSAFGSFPAVSAPLETMRTWSTVGGAQGPAAMVGSWQFDPGAEFYSWTGNGEWSPGGLYKSIGWTWANAAAGAYDSQWATAMANVKAKWERISRGMFFVSPFHEMNGNWFDHNVRGSEIPNFITAWRRWHAIQKASMPGSYLVFNTNGDTSGGGDSGWFYDWRTMWPGDAYVDVYSVDWYSNHWVRAGQTATSTSADQWGGPYGLEGHRQFALSRGKPFAIPEWGVNNTGTTNPQTGVSTGDVPQYIQDVYDFCKQNGGTGAGQLWYETVFNSTQNNNQFLLYPENQTKSPQSALRYKTLFRST